MKNSSVVILSAFMLLSCNESGPNKNFLLKENQRQSDEILHLKEQLRTVPHEAAKRAEEKAENRFNLEKISTQRKMEGYLTKISMLEKTVDSLNNKLAQRENERLTEQMLTLNNNAALEQEKRLSEERLAEEQKKQESEHNTRLAIDARHQQIRQLNDQLSGLNVSLQEERGRKGMRNTARIEQQIRAIQTQIGKLETEARQLEMRLNNNRR